MQIQIKAGDAVRVTSHATITDAGPGLLLWVNNRPVGHITSEQAEALRRVVQDPGKIATA